MNEKLVRTMEKIEEMKKTAEFRPDPEFPGFYRDPEGELAGPDQMPFEPADSFSTDPLSFEEITAALLEEAEDMFYATQVANRHSAYYSIACRSLEKLLRELGSCCVTRAVLERKGFAFPALADLSVEKLYGMLSFNFRKCRAVLLEDRAQAPVPVTEPEMLIRWYVLAERLTATGERVEAIRSGKISADQLIEAGAVRIRRPNAETPVRVERPEPLRKPASLPVRKAAARRELSARIDITDGRVMADARMEERRLPARGAAEQAGPLKDGAAADPLRRMRFIGSPAALHPSGQNVPPPETRKKLREKRKKRK